MQADHFALALDDRRHATPIARFTVLPRTIPVERR
jgi:hypothetical protein